MFSSDMVNLTSVMQVINIHGKNAAIDTLTLPGYMKYVMNQKIRKVDIDFNHIYNNEHVKNYFVGLPK